MTVRIALLFLILFLRIVPGLAQEKHTYSLQEAIELALQNNPEVLIDQREIESARGRKLQATSLEQPELTFGWEGIPSGEPISRADERTISLDQNVEFPYKLLLKKDISNREIDIATENLDRTKALITAEVKKAYFRVSHQSKLVETLESTLELLNEFRDATLFKYRAGDLPYFEVVRGKVEIAKTQNEIIEAKKELVSVKSEFNLLLGEKGFEEFELEDSLSYVPFEKSKEQVVQELTQKNRTLKIAQLSRERENRVVLSRICAFPEGS